MRKSTPLCLEEEVYNPWVSEEWEWKEVYNYNNHDKYYYYLLMENGKQIPLPLIEEILSNSLLKKLVPKEWWRNFFLIINRYNYEEWK